MERRSVDDALLEGREHLNQLGDGHGADALCHGVCVDAGMNYMQRVELEICHREAHRRREDRSRSVLDLETDALPTANHEQVEFCALIRAPKKALRGVQSQLRDDFLDDEAFPRGANLGVRDQIVVSGQVQQRVQDATVADVDLGCLDLLFADVLVPWW